MLNSDLKFFQRTARQNEMPSEQNQFLLWQNAVIFRSQDCGKMVRFRTKVGTAFGCDFIPVIIPSIRNIFSWKFVPMDLNDPSSPESRMSFGHLHDE